MFAIVDDSGTWWYSEGWCDDQPVAEEASAEPDGQQKQDVLVLSALVSFPEVPCLPCEPWMFDMSLEDDDGLYVEDHSEGFDLCLNRALTCCCLNSNFHDMYDFCDMWLDCGDLGAWTFEACCFDLNLLAWTFGTCRHDLNTFVHVGVDSVCELDPIDEKNEPNTPSTHGVLKARESMTECCETEGHMVSKPCEMMLNGIGPGESFWLLDSGASMSVVSRDVLKQFQHSEIQNNVGPLQAANGTSVDLEGSCKLLLQIEVLDRDGNVKPAVIPLDVMVGRTTYPIISVCKLTQQGWDVTFDQDHVRMFHRKSQHVVRDLSFWHDTPWIRVVPYEGNDVALNVSPVVADSFPKGDTVCALSADQMVQHRFRGHRPCEPTCEVCQSCRGVTKHSRKKTPKGTEFENHADADFGFLNKDFEWVPESEDSERGNVKFLVLRESYSPSIGCVLMTGDRQRDNRQLQKWLFEMGLWGSKDQHSLRVITDAESSVGNFIASAGLPMGVVVEWAPPQGHQANGTAERTIREIKESLKTLQLDFQKMGYTLVFSSLVLQCCMNYICFAHNNFMTVQQSSRTPRDLVIGDKARNHAFALFGCKVLAEIPESVKSKNPNLPRFVEGVYLHPEFSSMGVLVSARIRIGSEMVTQRFVAKSIKLCMPVEILDGHGLFVKLVDERSGLPEAPRSSEEVVVPLPSDLKCPATGPPVKWLDEHGVSLKCSACKEIEIRGTRGNKNHSRACMERYENWIRSELNLARGSKPSDSEPKGEQEVKREGSGREVSDLGGSESVPVTRQGALDSFEELDPLAFDPQDDVLTGPTAELKIEPKVESQEPVDVNLGGGEGSTSQAGSSSQSGGVSRPDSLGSYPKASVGVKRKWSEEDLMTERRGLKREPDVELAELDREVRDDNKRIDVKPDIAGLVSGMTCDSSLSETPINDLHEVYALAFLTTDSDDLICHLPLASLKFDKNASSSVVSFGDKRIRIWCPSGSIDDSTLEELPGDLTLDGMKTEIGNLDCMQCGDLMTESEIGDLRKQCRVIPSRWVTTRKNASLVRSRIVLKDIAKGAESARSLGISSPTPSSEALFAMLCFAGQRDWLVGAADISAAFMATPLRSRNVIAKLPASITSMTGEALYLWLSKALNGLRSASQEWNVYLSSIVDKCRLRSCGLEPCLYSGLLPSGEPCMILSYVDDLICVGPSVDAIDFVFDTVGKNVRLKRTGLIHDHSKGGQLRFLGRLITRRRGEKSLLISLPSNYLDDTFASYQIKTNAKGPPDVTPVIDREGVEELSSDAYARFRAALGKVSWMAQTRGDLRAWIGILATQQSRPTQYTEHAMRMLLRYLRGDMNVPVRFPSDSQLLDSEVFQGPHIVAFSDASHAPLRTTGRRGISGGVLTFHDVR